MQIFMPRTKEDLNPPVHHCILRQVDKIRDDFWQLKISCPHVSIIGNLYIRMNDEEIEMVVKEYQDQQEMK